MNKNDCFCLGYITKLFGYKGEINIYLDVDNPEYYKNLESVFVEVNKQLVPFFIEKIQLKGKGNATVRFQGVTTEELAQQILRSSLYLPLSALPKLSGSQFYYFEVIDFTVKDVKEGELGQVIGVIENPGNPLLEIKHSLTGKEILLPISDDTIIKVDRSSKSLSVEAPEGLIEIYLEE